MKVAFLDRDGTIIKDYLDQEWATVTTPEFLPESMKALRAIQSKGYQIIIITNQYIINDGIITEEQYKAFDTVFREKLTQHGVELLDVFYCPHNDADMCNCKKPKPGLILQAIAKHPEINLKKSFFVGDSLVDIGIAEQFQLPIYAINQETNYSNIIKIQQLLDILPHI